TIVFKRSIVVNSDFGVGYKLPVCARDIGIYLAVLVGLIVYPLKMKLGSLDFPDKKYLFAAAVPIALDGGIQLVSDLIPSLFTYESTNALRLLTGAIIGLAIPFYLVPILNLFWRSIVSNKA
ncbi:DUF2085 domain-containing protein, partial [Candidatus Parvarchaeota archaeon]|nr:DUF2085 domain-containing protein [Candidatus Parvarchaeota archaeon]